jgi:AmmeMemoRadiSam system protein B
MIRRPAVAGRFYPSDPQTLRRDLQSYLAGAPIDALSVIGLVAPHAGYVYSGAIAGEAYRRIRIPSRVIVLSPNHTGMGDPIAVTSCESWSTPLGDTRVDKELGRRFLELCPLASLDDLAHSREHAAEVHLPFLHFLQPHATVLPVVLGGLSYEECRRTGEAVAQLVRETKEERPLIVASSDMNHYESAETARRKDGLALDCIRALDGGGLYESVQSNDISMCGVLPVTILLTAARVLGAKSAEVVRYGNSGDVNGDYESVVGYAGVLIH